VYLTVEENGSASWPDHPGLGAPRARVGHAFVAEQSAMIRKSFDIESAGTGVDPSAAMHDEIRE
jgi:hypothetical protein